MSIRNVLIKPLILIVLVILIGLYKVNNPAKSIYFPKCPFRELTGYLCPGCGSQRAIYYLLNFDVFKAMKENAILVISIPYILAGLLFELIKKPGQKILKWRKILFGQKAIYIILFVIIVFSVLRNITWFQ
jgi:hypothetical protein